MPNLFDKALQFLARREYSEKELRQKLHFKYPEQDAEIHTAIERLKDQGYLSNERFLESRVRHRLQQGYGPNKIIAELSQMHGFSRSAILVAIDALQEEETESPLKILIEKRFSQVDFSDHEMRNKVVQYCLRRGFHLDEIKKALLGR